MGRDSSIQPLEKYVGKSVHRVDAFDKVTGKALYSGDLSRPGMLFLKVLFANRPHAKIVNLDTRRAKAVPGVVEVLTAKDVPLNEYGIIRNDQPVLCDDVVRFEGDQVAVVIAESEQAAIQGRDLIDVVYEDLPVVSDPRKAMLPDSFLVHSENTSNVLKQYVIRKGNVSEGFEQAAVTISGSYTLPMQEHAYMEPEAGIAYLEDDKVVVMAAGQWVHHDRAQIAHALKLEPVRVRLIYPVIGGAFGGREDLSVQIVLALASKKTGRPVKIIWNREESVRGHCKRHQMFINARWGATREGKLTAAEVEVIADAGAYCYTSPLVLGMVVSTITGVYEIPNVKMDAYAVYTNNVPAGAFRGFGSPQSNFVAELQIEKLAEKLNLDPITIRERNLLRNNSLLACGTPLPDELYLDHLLQEGARAAGWSNKNGSWQKNKSPESSDSSRQNGTGFALGLKNVGFVLGFPEKSTATIELHGKDSIQEAVVHFAGPDCGQGAHTVIRQMTADKLKLPLDRIILIDSDTHRSPESGPSSASRLTFMGGHAILGAVEAAMAKWNIGERPAVGTYIYSAPPTSDFDPQTGYGKPNFAYSAVAQVVDVCVDLETGDIEVPRIDTVVDVGKAINPVQIEAQTEGAVAQAAGYAIMENFISKDGVIQTANLSTYLIPTIMDVPQECKTHILELPFPLGPWGARGIGETVFLGVPPAVVSAVKDATGVWFDKLPLTPFKVLAGLNGIKCQD